MNWEKRYNELINAFPDGFIVFDSVGTIVLANEAAASLLGYANVDELCNQSVSTLYVNAGDHDSLLSILGYRGRADKTIFDWKKKNGDPVLVELTATPLHDEQKHVIGIHGIFHDITSKLRSQIAQQEVLAATTSELSEAHLLDVVETYLSIPMGLILQGVAHNLNTPLGSIRGRAELLQHHIQKQAGLVDRITEPNVRSEMQDFHGKLLKGVAEVIHQVDKAGTLIKGFTDKLSSEMTPGMMELDLNAVIRNELNFLESSLYFKHKITAEVALDPTLPRIRAPYKPFSAAIHGVILNSLKATSGLADRALEIRTSHGAEGIRIELSDNRPPMSDDDIRYTLSAHFATRHHDVPPEARFSPYDIEVAIARQMLDPLDLDIDVTSGERTRFVILVPPSLYI
jgi:PAS domain S-box-containing protein